MYGYCCNTTCFYHISLCLLDELTYVGGAAKASWMASNGVGIETKAKENTAICERKIKSIWKIGCNRYMTEILGIDLVAV